MKILFCTVLSLLLFACNPSKQVNVALGTLERDRIAHTATVNEVIVSLPVLPGSQVSKGDILVVLDDNLQQSSLKKAQAELMQSQAHLEKLRQGAREEEVAQASANVEGAKAALIESEANYLRAKNLAKDNLASEANLNRALASRDKKRATLHAFEEALRQLTNGTRIEDLQMAEANLLATQATVNSEQKKLDDLTVRATRDGILDNLPWNLGERVTQGSPLAIVLAGTSPFARVYIPEPYRVKVNIGDTLTVHVDGLAQSIEGKVRWIAHEPAFSPYYALNQDERARLMFLAEVQLPESEQSLPNGLPAQVELP
ncbi:HlyD family secretion protein [Litorilituus lipolyticus]|uniref:HlyD family secretion protein n=1 Tax=Litorilituus lipolyticus TaxID=2491017 RepID=UPI003CCC81AE